MAGLPDTSSSRRFVACRLSLIVLSSLLYLAPSKGDESDIPSAAIYYEDTVGKIIADKCVRCHNPETRKAGIDLTTPEGILLGGESGRIVQASQPDESLLFQMIDADEMPPEDEAHLTQSQKDSIRNWLTAGARFRQKVAVEPAVTHHDILPILHLRCVVCHGGRRKEADLDLRTTESILAGGKSGPAAVPGDPDQSLIVQRVHAEEMPPRRKLVAVSVKPMETLELQRLSKWIQLGLPRTQRRNDEDAMIRDSLITDDDRSFWSFRTPQRPTVPRVESNDRVRNPVDAFILRKLEAQGLSLSADADRTTLLRRAYLDLTGLPPDPEDIEAFLRSTDPNAYERVIDRLLESRHYGERWGRYWLDIAGYADSEGAQNEDRVRPHMYRYRDYVIRSFNDDKPYSRFLHEQIAGDELADYEHAEVIDQQLYDNLVATGFLRTAPDRTFANITNFVPDRLEVIADEIDVLGTAVLGLTLKCARCHSHKFDPIPQQDYYRLTAVLKDAYDEHDWLKSQGPRTLPHVTTQERQKFEQHEKQITNEITALQEQLRLKKEAAADLQLDKSKESQLKTDCEALERQIKDLEAKRWPEPRIRALWSRGQPSPTYVLKRGNYLTAGRPVEPGVPSVLSREESRFEVQPPWPNATATGRRLALARWLTAPDHPLTARVIVNRIWQHHFGTGIVTTPGNFGKAGALPTHPDLLDWLATEFVRRGWSIKAIHRLILNSSTWRQSSLATNKSIQRDADGTLYSRAPLRRLQAEVLRDTLLFVSGQLDDTPYGPADPVQLHPDGLVTSHRSERGWRRSIYVLQRRTQIPTLLENFDYPQMGPNCVQRSESLVAPQALHLMNNRMVFQLAEHFADRVRSEAGDDQSAQVERVYLRAFGRRPTTDELAVASEALGEFARNWADQKHDDAGDETPARQALVTWCHAMLNLAEFLYVD